MVMDMPSDRLTLNPEGRPAGREQMPGKPPRPKTVTVDLHNHMLVPAAADLVKPHLPADHHPSSRFTNEHSRKVNQRQGEERRANFTSVHQGLEDMDKMDQIGRAHV